VQGISISDYRLPVMAVPDHVRDDKSGIRLRSTMQRNWIPGQARNDVMIF
jgi:hypothetical protein